MKAEDLKVKWDSGDPILTSEIEDYLSTQCKTEVDKLDAVTFQQIVRLCAKLYESNVYNYHPGNSLFAFIQGDLHHFICMADDNTMAGLKVLELFYQNVAKPFLT